MNRRNLLDAVVFASLVAGGAATRLALQEIPNFAPVAALALFSGYFFQRRAVALSVPLLVMALSDASIGGYDWRLMTVVYAMLALPALAGDLLRRVFTIAPQRWAQALRSTAGLVGCSLASSLAFFGVTNFAVWCLSTSYAATWAGLVECYAMGVPFFRYTLAGDLSFSVLLFVGYALVVASGAVRPATRAVVLG